MCIRDRASIFIWVTSNLGFVDGSFGLVEDMDHSLLAVIGSAVLFLFRPLGFETWQPVVATVMGLVAKEEVVGEMCIRDRPSPPRSSWMSPAAVTISSSSFG